MPRVRATLSKRAQQVWSAAPAGLFSLAPVLALLLIAFAQFSWSARDIEATAPYPQQPDQRHLVHQAETLLKTGSLNPKWFRYPSVPIYLTTVGMTVGIFQEQKNPSRKSPLRVSSLGKLDKPFITHPRVVRAPRMLFAALGVAGLCLFGVLAQLLYGGERSRHWLWAVPATLLLSSEFYNHTSTYLNVDIVAAFAAAVTLVSLLVQRNTTSFGSRVVFPAACVGFAIASKYTMGVLLAPAVASLWLFRSPSPLLRSAWMCVLSLAFFVLFCPFSVLDLGRFVDDVGYEVWHYAVRGHPGYMARPGWHQFVWYLKTFADDLSWAGVALAAIGMVAGLRRDWRGTAVCLAFFLPLLALLVGQRVHFSRNALGLIGLLSLWMVVGAVALHHALVTGLARLGSGRFERLAHRRTTAIVLAVPIALGVVLGLPLHRAQARLAGDPDSRVEFVQWAGSALAKKVIHIPKELPIDTRELERKAEVKRFSLDKKSEVTKVAKRKGEYFLNAKWIQKQQRNLAKSVCGNVVYSASGRTMNKLLTVDPELSLVEIKPCK